METSRFKLPLLSASQAQKHVTVNEALTMLDLLVGVIPVASRALNTPGGLFISMDNLRCLSLHNDLYIWSMVA